MNRVDETQFAPGQAHVAVLIADGITADEIAAQLGCGVPTVRTHTANVMAKIGAQRLSDAVRLLRQGEAHWSTAGRWQVLSCRFTERDPPWRSPVRMRPPTVRITRPWRYPRLSVSGNVAESASLHHG